MPPGPAKIPRRAWPSSRGGRKNCRAGRKGAVATRWEYRCSFGRFRGKHWRQPCPHCAKRGRRGTRYRHWPRCGLSRKRLPWSSRHCWPIRNMQTRTPASLRACWRRIRAGRPAPSRRPIWTLAGLPRAVRGRAGSWLRSPEPGFGIASGRSGGRSGWLGALRGTERCAGAGLRAGTMAALLGNNPRWKTSCPLPS